jgi:hypothetical protein
MLAAHTPLICKILKHAHHAMTIVCLLLKHIHAMTMVLPPGLLLMHQHANQLSFIIIKGIGGNVQA